VHSERSTHDTGKQVASELPFSNPNEPQALQWSVRSASKQPVAGIVVELNGKLVADLGERTLPPGGCLKYAGGPTAVICDSAWRVLARVEVDAAASRIGTGNQQVKLRCAAQDGSTLKLELRTLGSPTRIGLEPARGQ
jgi:hypothetical protein